MFWPNTILLGEEDKSDLNQVVEPSVQRKVNNISMNEHWTAEQPKQWALSIEMKRRRSIGWTIEQVK